MVPSAFGSKRVEPSLQMAGHVPVMRMPLSEGHLLYDKTVEYLQAYRRLRHIRALRAARRKIRHLSMALRSPAAFESPALVAKDTSIPAPSPMAKTGVEPKTSRVLSSVGHWEMAKARVHHALLSTGHVLSAATSLLPVGFTTAIYYLDYIPQARKFHPEIYPMLRDIPPETIHFMVQYGIPAAVGILALYKAILQFKSRLEATWVSFHHPSTPRPPPPVDEPLAPSAPPSSTDVPGSIEPSGWGP